ncbi:unnamed protein product [Cladocopium goreaui]|uniref:ANK_REP_REGION domain-containing protein n=1 Tax=Cladocopium goreaui TaxID=2562237 RepID=A0A9P1GCQ5_9DINO|nr:unnamed protein product [Cladocopium goreaui]
MMRQRTGQRHVKANVHARDAKLCTALHYSAHDGNAEAAKVLLQAGSSAFARNCSATPRDVALLSGLPECKVALNLKIVLRCFHQGNMQTHAGQLKKTGVNQHTGFAPSATASGTYRKSLEMDMWWRILLSIWH